jgi:hypothetical protein
MAAVGDISVEEITAAFVKANTAMDALRAEYGWWTALRESGAVMTSEDHDRLAAAIDAVLEGTRKGAGEGKS